MATPIKFKAEVSRVIRHSADVATYEFRYLDKRPRYKPGQFLHLALDAYDPSGHWPESRVFTIAKGATDREFIRLTIAVKGAFTRRILAELEPGRQVWMKAPYGEFIVRTDPQRETVLIAGGTGMSPFVAFLEDALVTGLEGDVRLHYGARSPDLLVFRGLVDRCTAALSGIRADLYAEEGATDGVIAGKIGLPRICSSLPDARRAMFYLCGPQPMVDGFRGQLSDRFGVPVVNIKTDEWE